MGIGMQIFKQAKLMLQTIWFKLTNKPIAPISEESIVPADADRIARLERNYLVLLKRVLEMDGVLLVTSKTNHDEKNNNGLNEHKPTIH